jgi:hypothetical protein
VLYEYSRHDLEKVLGVRELCETECCSFPLAKDEGPLIDQSAVVREDLASVVPLVETGRGTVEIVVSILNVLVNGVAQVGVAGKVSNMNFELIESGKA